MRKEIKAKLRRERASLKRQRIQEKEEQARKKRHRKIKAEYRKKNQTKSIQKKRRNRPLKIRIASFIKRLKKFRVKKLIPFLWFWKGFRKQERNSTNRDSIFIDWIGFFKGFYSEVLLKKYFWSLPSSYSGRTSSLPVKKVCTPEQCLSSFAFNSLSAFLLSMFLVFWLAQFYNLLGAKLYDLSMVFFNSYSIYSLKTTSGAWSGVNIMVISSFGPVMVLLTGLIIRSMFIRRYFRFNFIRLLFVWLYIHSLLFSLGSYHVGALTNTGFVYAVKWMFMSNLYSLQVLVFFFLFGIILVLLGRKIPSLFYMASPCSLFLRKHNRGAFLSLVMLFPWLCGFGFILLLNYPKTPPAFWLYGIILGLLLVPAYINRFPAGAELISKKNYCRTGIKTLFFWLFLATVLWLSARFIFWNGVEV